MATPTAPSTAAKKGATPLATPASPTERQGAKSPARAGKKSKPTLWRRYADQLFRAEQLDRKITASAQASQVANTDPEAGKLLQALTKAGGRGDTIKALHALDAAKVPVVKAPPPPKFSKGDVVSVKKEFLARYTRDGLYTIDNLQDMEVVAVSTNGKAFLCCVMDTSDGGDDSNGGPNVRIQTFKHLVKVA